MKVILLALFFIGSSLASAAWENRTFRGSNVYVYFPASYTAQKSYPLMVNLHGCAQKGSILVEHGNWTGAADRFETIIVIPEVPNGGVIAGCWDYYGTNHTRTNRHNGFILDLVNELKSNLKINEDKVFISGLSSGAGLSMVLACLAPDVFKGIGLNAGPSLGTSSGEISRATIRLEQVRNNCETLAASVIDRLASQKVSVIYGNNDFLVDPNYNKLNARVFASLLKTDGEMNFDLDQFPGTNTKGKGTLYLKGSQPLVSLIENTGLGHNWPAGQGGSPRSFVSKNSLDYPYYLLSFLVGE
jgi:poly(3-hydroxybutyrate) depolymerase